MKRTVNEARLVLGGSNTPRRLIEVESYLKGRKLDDPVINKAARLSVSGAKPLKHNGYKVPLIKGIVTQVLKAI